MKCIVMINEENRMESHVELFIDHSEKGFKQFIRYTLRRANDIVDEYERGDICFINDEDYALAKTILSYYKYFARELGIKQKRVLEIISHGHYEELTDDYYDTLEVVYNKWEKLFFSNEKQLYKGICHERLGILLKAIRKRHCISRVSLGKCIGYSYPQICKFENAEQDIPFDYLAKFSQVFNCSIDEIIKNSLKCFNKL